MSNIHIIDSGLTFNNWLFAEGANIHRLHITHTDLDGYACRVLTTGVLKVLNEGNEVSTKYYHVDPGKDINAVEEYITSIESNYRKGDMLYILITDLSNIDISYYNYLVSDGHNVKLFIIDHHQKMFRNYNENNTTYIKNNMWCRQNKHHSATDLLYATLYECFDSKYGWWQHGPSVFEPFLDGIGRFGKNHSSNKRNIVNDLYQLMFSMGTYAHYVSLYDTGNWGEWNNDKITVTMEYKLMFISYKKRDMLEEYIHDTLNNIVKDIPDIIFSTITHETPEKKSDDISIRNAGWLQIEQRILWKSTSSLYHIWQNIISSK